MRFEAKYVEYDGIPSSLTKLLGFLVENVQIWDIFDLKRLFLLDRYLAASSESF
jgi:hypothetical protein